MRTTTCANADLQTRLIALVCAIARIAYWWRRGPRLAAFILAAIPNQLVFAHKAFCYGQESAIRDAAQFRQCSHAAIDALDFAAASDATVRARDRLPSFHANILPPLYRKRSSPHDLAAHGSYITRNLHQLRWVDHRELFLFVIHCFSKKANRWNIFPEP